MKPERTDGAIVLLVASIGVLLSIGGCSCTGSRDNHRAPAILDVHPMSREMAFPDGEQLVLRPRVYEGRGSRLLTIAAVVRPCTRETIADLLEVVVGSKEGATRRLGPASWFRHWDTGAGNQDVYLVEYMVDYPIPLQGELAEVVVKWRGRALGFSVTRSTPFANQYYSASQDLDGSP